MIHAFQGNLPHVAMDAWVAQSSDVIGRVEIGSLSSVFFHSVLRGDQELISIGSGSNIQDGCILHTDPGHRLRIGKGVSVGHGAILHGCHIHDNCLIGMGAIILNGAEIEPYCIIGAGALIKENMHIPSGSLVVGTPGRILRSISEEQRLGIVENANHYVELAKAYHRKDEDER